MSAELFNRLATLSNDSTHNLDPAFAARSRLVKLRDTLLRTAKTLRPTRWDEPAIFFFNPQRQAELTAARRVSSEPFAELTAMIASELPALLASVEMRRLARAIGMNAAAATLAPRCSAAKNLADLLAIPDDEVFLALAPAMRVGVRLHVRGAAEVAQLYRLIATAVAISDFQLHSSTAIQSDGTLPTGLAGCAHWLWPTQSLTAIPRINGERVVLIDSAFVRLSLDVETRFPALAVESEVIQTLTAFQVTEELSRLAGHPLLVHPVSSSSIARAA